MATAKDDWDEPTDDSKTRVRRSNETDPSSPFVAPRRGPGFAAVGPSGIATDDDETSYDEGGERTRAFDAAKLLRELQIEAARDAGPTSSTRAHAGFRSGTPAATAPDPARVHRIPTRPRGADYSKPLRHRTSPEDGRTKAQEATPLVGEGGAFSIDEEITNDALTRFRPPAEADVIVDEASLSPEEEEAVRAAEAEEAREIEEHARFLQEQYAELLKHDIFPRVVLGRDGIGQLKIDHRAGFLLSMIDGVSTVMDLLDVCGMPHMEALALIYHLADRGIVALERVDSQR